MKKIIVTSAVLLSVTASACTVERVIEKPSDMPATVESTSAPYVPSDDYELTQEEKESGVINFVIEFYGSLPNSRDEVLETAYLVCDNLRGGATLQDLEQMIFDASTTQDDLTYLSAITAGAVGFLCPEFMPGDV